jgi:hypothetical protein
MTGRAISRPILQTSSVLMSKEKYASNFFQVSLVLRMASNFQPSDSRGISGMEYIPRGHHSAASQSRVSS